MRINSRNAATYALIQKKNSGSRKAALIISNKEIEDTIKIIKSLEESSLLIKGVTETIKNEKKNKKVDLPQCYWVH